MRIVGISPSHDSSVCVINDGKLEGFYKEERFCGIKKESKPYLSILEAHKNIKGPVDFVVISTPDGIENDHGLSNLAKRLFGCEILDLSESHHITHAALAFENSGFDESIVIVIDRNGTVIDQKIRESETVLLARKNPYSFSEIYKNYWCSGQGELSSPITDAVVNHLRQNKPKTKIVARSCFNTVKVYESATTLIGEHPLENGKTMGLSAYGNPAGYPDLFLRSLDPDVYCVPHDSYFLHEQRGSFVIPVVFRELNHLSSNGVPKKDYEVYADFAKHVQNQTQEEVCRMIQHWVHKTGIKNVVITGGYGLNVVANSYFIEKLPEVNFFFEPMADDTGNSIGAAMLVYKEKSGTLQSHPLTDTFFHGNEYSLDHIEGKDVDLDEIADLILDQKSVAVYQGYAEAGQRALGNRSILFDATNPDARTIVNLVKKREWYRPFAAMILEEDANEYFDMLGLKKSESMTNSFQVRPQYKELLKGICHVDGSCRLQTINKTHSLYDLLIKIKEKNAVGIVLNTSFNLAGQPLVETPDQALETLKKSTLNYLWFPTCQKLVSNL